MASAPTPNEVASDTGKTSHTTRVKQGSGDVVAAMLNAVPDDVLASYVCQKMVTNPQFADVLRSFDTSIRTIQMAGDRLAIDINGKKGNGQGVA